MGKNTIFYFFAIIDNAALDIFMQKSFSCV